MSYCTLKVTTNAEIGNLIKFSQVYPCTLKLLRESCNVTEIIYYIPRVETMKKNEGKYKM